MQNSMRIGPWSRLSPRSLKDLQALLIFLLQFPLVPSDFQEPLYHGWFRSKTLRRQSELDVAKLATQLILHILMILLWPIGQISLLKVPLCFPFQVFLFCRNRFLSVFLDLYTRSLSWLTYFSWDSTYSCLCNSRTSLRISDKSSK